ncbi:hypothetical protein [Actinocorallia aurea]
MSVTVAVVMAAFLTFATMPTLQYAVLWTVRLHDRVVLLTRGVKARGSVQERGKTLQADGDRRLYGYWTKIGYPVPSGETLTLQRGDAPAPGEEDGAGKHGAARVPDEVVVIFDPKKPARAALDTDRLRLPLHAAMSVLLLTLLSCEVIAWYVTLSPLRAAS